jgi:hypothetical protein
VVAGDLEARRFPVRSAERAHRLGVGRAEGEPLDAEVAEGRADRARRGDRNRSGQGREPVDERLLVREAVHVAGAGMGQDDDRGLDGAERPRGRGESGNEAARALLHAIRAAGLAQVLAGVEAREVDGHAGRSHPIQLGLDGGIAGRDQHADATTPAVHRMDLLSLDRSGLCYG